MTPMLDPDLLLQAYAMGIFPMAQGRADPQVHWIDPRRRGIFPLDDFHISRSLARLIRRWNCAVRTDTAFEAVVDACAAREETWINPAIRSAYLELHRQGHAHSLEVWCGDRLAGGVYGVTLGAAFFGESMFSAESSGSKVALAFLVHRLRAGGFRLFDTQFLTPHLASLGAVEIPRAEYHRRLAEAIALPARFEPEGYSPSASSVLSGVSSASGGA
ncbi:leucyl/phenylalanyl-tRNA--protein transferase [Rhodobacter sp. SGA-6-6]|nr:leucyl/phenylalanyl-tRNA--protein transferase [Rhodobacter sp. SGA-6-6]